MSKRTILLLAGVVFAYSAVYFGDGIHVMVVEDEFSLPKGEWSGYRVLAVIVGIILAIAGTICWCKAMVEAFDADDLDFAVLCAAPALILPACLFGIIAGPFANYGPYPWYWASRWVWLLIAALVPTVLVARDMLSEAIIVRRNRKAAGGDNVSPMRRGSA